MNPWIELKRAGRSLRRSPGFTATVVGTLALGIGANLAIFAAAWAALWAPLPLREPDRLLAVWETQAGNDRRGQAPANFLDVRRAAQTLEGAAAYFRAEQVFEQGEGVAPRRVSVAKVSSQFFEVLGPQPQAGSFFRGGELESTAVVSAKLWREIYGDAPFTTGRTLRLDGQLHPVVAIAPATFDLPAGTRVWTLAPRDVAGVGLDAGGDPTTLRNARYLGVYARLAEGATLASANAELAAIAGRLAAEYPDDNEGTGLHAFPLDVELGHRVREPLLLLGGGALAILLIACANIAGLLLARGLARQRDFAVHAALGASRSFLFGHALAEACWLATAGGVAGALLARWGAPLLFAALPGAEASGRPLGLGLPLWVAAAALLLFTLLATAALPAWAAARIPPALTLAGSRGAVSPGRGRLRGSLVVVQAALALVLVAGALLLVRTLHRLQAVDPGFDADRVATVRLWAPGRQDFPPVARRELLHRAVDAAAALPGALSAGAILKLPLTGTGFSAGMRVEGREFPTNQLPDAAWRVVDGAYFDTLSIPLRAGRLFAENESAAPVAIVNTTLATQFWASPEAALGQRIGTGLDAASAAEAERGPAWVTIVGVVGDTPHENLRTPARPEMYRPLRQANRSGGETVALVVKKGPGYDDAALRAALRAVSPELVVEPEVALGEILARVTARERLLGRLLALFGSLALLLAGLGLYGVLQLQVAERRRELGIRLALGATARDLVAMVWRHGARQAAWGTAIGLGAVLLLGRALRSWLWEIGPTDPASLALAVAALWLAALLAAALPARSAARTAPADVLRES